MVTNKQLRLAVETEEERTARLENNGSGWPWRRRKKSKTEEDGSYQTAQVGPGDRGRKKSKIRNGIYLD